MKPFPGKGRVFYQAPREIEAIPDLSSDAKRLWAYGRFREYPAKPAELGEGDFEKDLAMRRRTVQRAKRALLRHDPPLLIVHRRGTRNAPKSLLHFLLPRESMPRCCALKVPQAVQPAKTDVTMHRVGGLTGTAQAGCDGATPDTTSTCAPHKTEQIKEREKNAGRAGASPNGPPPAGDGDGDGNDQASPPFVTRLIRKIGPDRFSAWFGRARIEEGEGVVRIAVRKQLLAEDVRKKFAADLESMADGRHVEVCVEEPAGAGGEETSRSSNSAAAAVHAPALADLSDDPDACCLAAARRYLLPEWPGAAGAGERLTRKK